MSSSQAEWMEVRIGLPAAEVEAAEAALFELGAASVTLLDAEDQPVHEPDPGEVRLWPDVVVQGLFAAESFDHQGILDQLMNLGLVTDRQAIEIAPLADQDWERAWMDQYQPLRFGQGLWICPSHIEPDPDWPLVIRLDPGLAFGSGTHPTTAMCLALIDGAELKGLRVIDFGCGSGILAIACALKGAERVIGVDHDPQALQATADNAARNGVAARISALAPDDFEPEPVDCVLANILAGPLIELAPQLIACLKPGGRLVLSGILAEQAESVAEAYRAALGRPEILTQEDWVRLVFRT
jgi:ribosomal protein L11 methyltransferase